MIYNQSEFSKEKKQAFIEEHESRRNLLWRGLIVALCTFSGHFMLQTLTRSILPSVVPELMMPSHFSVLNLYIFLSFAIYCGFIAKYYNYLTYAEISLNKWYTLVKFGYNPNTLIFVKLLMRILEVITFYSIGFISTIFLTLFLKYPFIPNYFLPLYLAGLIDLIFITIVTMSCSLYISEQKKARYIVLLSASVVWLLRITTGFYDLIADRILMSSGDAFANMLGSHYISYFMISICIGFLMIYVRAKRIAQYTNFPFYKKDMDLVDQGQIVILADEQFIPMKEGTFVKKQHNKMMDRAINIGFTFLILAGIVINLFVLFVSLSSPERETNFFGVIPFIFHTESMQPEIMYNDLAFFSSNHIEKNLQTDSIVLYREGLQPVVAKVQSMQDDTITLDILNYQENEPAGKYVKTIDKDSIYGIYSGCSRWLGMVILFANTMFGRLLLLLIPALMIYYYKPLIDYLKKKGYMIE